jgi:transposase
MTVEITRQASTAAQLRAEAARCQDARVSRRTLAIALVLEGVPRWKAAETCGMDRQTLRDWVHRYNAEGLAGLHDRRHGGGRAGKLSAAQQAEFAGWVEAGPDLKADKIVRWRRRDLQQKLAACFGVSLHERSVGKLLKRLDFSHISVRPRHPKADRDTQEAHKKTSTSSLRRRSLKPPATRRSNSGGRMKRGSVSKAR